MTTLKTSMPALREKGKAGRALTANQVGCVLNEIAATAIQIDELAIELQSTAGHLPDADLLAGVIQALAQRIGWAADMAADRIPGSGGAAFGKDAAGWMLPGSFHEDDDQTKAAKAARRG